MKLVMSRCDVTPKEPVYLAGYIQRKTRFEGVHDPITATVMVFTIKGEKIVWSTADLGGGSNAVIDEVIKRVNANGIALDRDHFVFGGTHTHSGPVVNDSFTREQIGEPEKNYFDFLCDTLTKVICECWNKDGEEVHAKYSNIIIDGLYSNRNDKNKLSDKNEYMLGFFNNDDQLVGVYHLMSHHCTVIGPQSMMVSADLFGALRSRLEKHFGCLFLMAQGNAGDMGNRQYRNGNDFAAVEREANDLMEQIVNKYSWKDIDIDNFEHKSVVYHAKYHVDYGKYKDKYEEYKSRLAVETDFDMIKQLTGWVKMAERKKDLPSKDIEVDMPAEIITMNQLQIALVPGELGSILGLRIKEASKAKLAFVWGYVNGCDLGYMIEKEAFSTESQESQVTNYNPGVCEEYIETIINNL